MSVTASIDINLSNREGYSFSAEDIINQMLHNGWRVINNGKIFYLPVGDVDDFDWQNETISKENFMEIVRKKETAKEIIGVDLYWDDSAIGVSMLIYPNYEISFSLSINRVTIDVPSKSDITDASWYLKRIITCFRTDKLVISKFTFTQD